MTASHMTPAPIIWAIGGLPGTGKSTLGRLMEKQGLGLRISSDEVRRQLGLWDIYSPGAKAAVYAEMAHQARSRIIEGTQRLILEATFSQAETQFLLKETALSAQAELRLIWLEASASTLQARVAKPRADSQADPDALRHIAQQAQAPSQPWLHLRSDLLTPEALLNAVLKKAKEPYRAPQ